MKSRLLPVCMTLLFSGGVTQCELHEVYDGYPCPENTDGNYADDSITGLGTDEGVKNEIAVTGRCSNYYPYCMTSGTQRKCLHCKEGSYFVGFGAGSTECVDCDKIYSRLDECDNYRCMMANKECNIRDNCIEACIDGKLTICNKGKVFDEVVCPNGCNSDGTSCEGKCGLGEIYFSTKDECLCDEDNHWGGSRGACKCKAGYVQRDGKCMPLSSSSSTNCPNDGEIYDETTRTCICNKDGHWDGEPGNCECVEGYIQYQNQCIEKVKCPNTGERPDYTTNKCVCDRSNNWEGDPDNCKCKTGFVEVNRECVLQAECDKLGEKYDAAANKCVCDGEKNWEEKAGGCSCKTGFVEINHECVKQSECNKPGEKYDDAANQCVCDGSKHWKTDENGGCTCKYGYKESSNQCIKYKVGESFYIGNWYFSNNNEKPRLEWQILEVKSDAYIMITKYAVVAHPFHTAADNTMWNKSAVRSYLNGEFWKAAFDSDGNKKYIAESEISNTQGVDHGSVGTCETVKDHVYLLSSEESLKYLSAKNSREAYITPYAIRYGKYKAFVAPQEAGCIENCHASWWLRSPGGLNGFNAFVSIDGSQFDGYSDLGIDPSTGAPYANNGVSKDDISLVLRPVIKVMVEK